MSNYLNKNKEYIDNNVNNIDVIFNDELSLKGEDLEAFLKTLPNVTEYGKGIASMNGITKHLKIPKSASSKPTARYQALIVNTANLLEPGEHWFLMGTDWGGANPLEGQSFYFDSYGRPLELIYQQAGTNIPRNLDLQKWQPINQSSYQSLGTNACGYYLFSVLHLMNQQNLSPQAIGRVLDTEYMNKKSSIFHRDHVIDVQTALSNDLSALKNAETLGSIYTPSAEWYKKLRSELYD